MPKLVELSSSDRTAGLVGDAAESDAEGLEAQAIAVRAVIESIMMMAMKEAGSANAARQLVDRVEAVRMTARCLVRYQDLGALSDETRIVGRKDRAAMLTRQASAPAVALAASSGVIVCCVMLDISWWHPYLPPEDAAQASDPNSGNLHHAAVQVRIGERRSE